MERPPARPAPAREHGPDVSAGPAPWEVPPPRSAGTWLWLWGRWAQPPPEATAPGGRPHLVPGPGRQRNLLGDLRVGCRGHLEKPGCGKPERAFHTGTTAQRPRAGAPRSGKEPWPTANTTAELAERGDLAGPRRGGLGQGARHRKTEKPAAGSFSRSGASAEGGAPSLTKCLHLVSRTDQRPRLPKGVAWF